MTPTQLMDQSSFSVSFQSGQSDSQTQDMNKLSEKKNTGTNHEVNDKSPLPSHNVGLPPRISASEMFNKEEKTSASVAVLQARCNKLEEFIVFLLHENAALSRDQQETRMMSSNRKYHHEDRKFSLKSPDTQLQVCASCDKDVVLVMEKAAQLTMQNDEHILKICELEEIIRSLEETKGNEDIYKQRIESLRSQVLLKETEIAHLKGCLAQDASKKNNLSALSVNRKEVLQLCEKYQHLMKSSKKMQYCVAKLQHEKTEATLRMHELEQELQLLKRKRSISEHGMSMKKTRASAEVELTNSRYDVGLEMGVSSYKMDHLRHGAPVRHTKPKSILKESKNVSEQSFAASGASSTEEKSRKNPVIINEKRSSNAMQRYHCPSPKNPQGMMDIDMVPRHTDKSFYSDDREKSEHFESGENSLCHAWNFSDYSAKGSRANGHEDVETTSSSSSHIGRYEFLQEIDHMRCKGKHSAIADIELSARQQEYADKLIQKYIGGINS